MFLLTLLFSTLASANQCPDIQGSYLFHLDTFRFTLTVANEVVGDLRSYSVAENGTVLLSGVRAEARNATEAVTTEPKASCPSPDTLVLEWPSAGSINLLSFVKTGGQEEGELVLGFLGLPVRLVKQ